jgi:uncharacterized cupin superfamily protein
VMLACAAVRRPRSHIHHNEDETLIVLEGEYQVLFNEQWQPLRCG